MTPEFIIYNSFGYLDKNINDDLSMSLYDILGLTGSLEWALENLGLSSIGLDCESDIKYFNGKYKTKFIMKFFGLKEDPMQFYGKDGKIVRKLMFKSLEV